MTYCTQPASMFATQYQYPQGYIHSPVSTFDTRYPVPVTALHFLIFTNHCPYYLLVAARHPTKDDPLLITLLHSNPCLIQGTSDVSSSACRRQSAPVIRNLLPSSHLLTLARFYPTYSTYCSQKTSHYRIPHCSVIVDWDYPRSFINIPYTSKRKSHQGRVLYEN